MSLSSSMDLFECPVCLSDMVDRSPRSLSCLHTFCSECLEQLINNRRITCPTCNEITEIKTNNVQELRVNFLLGQMRDQEQKQAQASDKETKSSPSSTCEVCQQTPDVVKCKDCPQLLCRTYKKRHQDIHEFKGHSVFDFCQKHKQEITYSCKQCVQPLCMRCMMLDHTETKTHFMKFDQGITTGQNNAKILKNNIEKVISKGDKSYKEIERKYQSVIEIESGLIKCRKQVEAQLKECDEYLKQTECKTEVYENLRDTFHRRRNRSTVAVASFNGLITSKLGFCEKYEKITQKADQCLRDMKKMMDMEYSLPNFIPADSSSGQVVKRMTAEQEVKNLKLAKTLITIQKSDEINCDCDAEFIGSNVLFPTSEKPYHVICLNKEGQVVARYYPKDTQKEVLGVDVYDSDIYMLQWNTITVITHKENNNITYNIDRINMSAMLVKDKTTIFVSQFDYPGGIIKYDTVKCSTDTVVEGLTKPTFISKICTSEGHRYILTETGAHCIRVYNDRWELLHSFGGKGNAEGLLSVPTATAITRMGTVLVADYNNHRISHYSLDGQFLSHVVTKHDGVAYPFAMCYKYLYLWVCCANFVKCFELKEV